MGNRRMGLGRLEALLENANFAATLTLDDSDVTVNSLTSDGAIVATAGGVTATAGGLTATAGGVTITAGGLNTGVPIVLPDAASTDLTHASHAGRLLVVPNVGQNSTFNLPTPTVVGQHYHFIFGGTAAEAENVILRTKTTDNSVTFKGAVNWNLLTANDNSDDASDLAFNTPVVAGSNIEILNLINPGFIDVHFVAFSTTVWYVWGNTTSDTVCTFA